MTLCCCYNRLATLGDLAMLERLFCDYDDNMKALPAELGRCAKLRYLSCGHNGGLKHS